MPQEALQEYVLMPPRGLAAAFSPAAAMVSKFLREMIAPQPGAGLLSYRAASAPGVRLRVLDSIGKNGPKLVAMSPDAMLALRVHQPGVRILPIVYYAPAVAPRPTVAARPRPAAARASVRAAFRVVSRRDGSPLAGAQVVAFTDFAAREGAGGATDARGVVRLGLGGATRLERLYVYPLRGHWSLLRHDLPLRRDVEFADLALEPVDLAQPDGLRHFYGAPADPAGAGVRVGIVDSGIDGSHPDLRVEGGANTVRGEDPADFGDNGGFHGTHVAGIVAGRGSAPTGVRGLAPGVALRSYRVFGAGAKQASNYSIAKAIDRAVTDGCDVVNLSLGGGPADDLTREAIEDARAAGCLAIVAAGNEDRSPVAFPARLDAAVAVSAMGRKGTFPKGTTEEGDIAAPFGTDRANFLGSFSNVGPQIDVTAPGVGILSTVPGGHAPMSGTSMACPAVTGFTASVLARNPRILRMRRNQNRADAIARLLFAAARTLGFGHDFEGHGMPR